MIIFIVFPLARFILSAVQDLFTDLGSKLAPDYFIGPSMYSVWWWLGMFVFPILFFIFWRGVVNKNDHHFELVGFKKRLVLLVVLIVILISFGYIAYPGSAFVRGLDQVTPGDSIDNNTIDDKYLGYSIVLYPRNGTWGKQEKFISQDKFISLPTSEGGYSLRVSMGEKRDLNGKEYFYSKDRGFLPLKPEGVEKMEEFSSNNIHWSLYKYLVGNTNNPEVMAVGIFHGKIVLLNFNYRDWQLKEKAVKAESDFEKTVKTFKFLDS